MRQRCWEAKSCAQLQCPVRLRDERHCWLSEPRTCFDGEHRNFRDRLSQCCQGCIHFHRSMGRSTGRRTAEHIFGDTLFRVMEELGGYQSELVAINQALRQKIRGLSTLDQVSKALQSTLDQLQIFHIILTGITAADILSLNRAFLFLVDDETRELQGAMAVGPDSPEEARQIWDGLERSGKTFIDLALVPHGEIAGNDRVTELARTLRLPLDDGGILARAVRERKSFLIADAAADILSLNRAFL
ncbi:MAG TPA: hypothetical protein VMF29_02010, partial [Candidatus Edwardsbacteria bacterium]|nr:hypothetical protein [Candidatus Edwardsbacteria bacterium]